MRVCPSSRRADLQSAAAQLPGGLLLLWGLLRHGLRRRAGRPRPAASAFSIHFKQVVNWLGMAGCVKTEGA